MLPTTQPHYGRPSKRLAGSRSEAQPPGASDGGTGGNTNTEPRRCKALRNLLWRAGLTHNTVRSLLQVLVIPGEDAVQPIEQVLFFVEAVGLTRVEDQLGFHTIALQPAVQFLALAQ